MKKIYQSLKYSALCMCFTTLTTYAQTIYTYDNDETGAFGTVVTGVSASDLSGVNGVVEINACGTGYSSDTWSTSTGAFSTAYSAIQVTITPDVGNSITVTDLQFDLGRNPQGPQRMRYAYSTNGGASWTNNGSDLSISSGSCGAGTTFTWDMPDFTSTTPIIFRIYGWNASNVNGQQRTYNGEINGTVCTMSTWYADTDGDNYGDASNTTLACTAPSGYVADNTDCDDAVNTVYPGAAEICDGLDNDCDGDIDENLVNANIEPADSAITCKGFPVTFSTTSCIGCTYQWFKNDNIIVGATDFSYTTTKPAYYSVQVTIPGGCNDVSDHSLLISGFNPNANIYYPNGLNLCAPSPGTNILVKVGYLATNVYQWYKDGTPYLGDGANSWKIYPSEPGLYRCHITSIDGCDRITDAAVVINSCRLEENSSALSSIYPNPASEQFTITFSASINSTAYINITDMLGKSVYNENIITSQGVNSVNINSANFAKGAYLIEIIADNTKTINNIIIN